ARIRGRQVVLARSDLDERIRVTGIVHCGIQLLDIADRHGPLSGHRHRPKQHHRHEYETHRYLLWHATMLPGATRDKLQRVERGLETLRMPENCAYAANR